MKFKEYLEQSEKTLSTQFNIDGEKEQKVLHSIIGMLTEVEELMSVKDGVNLKEEISDVFWYSAIIYREYNFDFKYEYIKSENNILEFLNKTLVLLDMFKKKIYYNKQIDDVLFEKQFHKSMNHIFSLCADNNLNINEIFELNIAKLMKRYGDKFSSESAINRNLEEERKIMEGF
jgi:NTP pyrophosphatase (non-canonical NTP hydrolase)